LFVVLVTENKCIALIDYLVDQGKYLLNFILIIKTNRATRIEETQEVIIYKN